MASFDFFLKAQYCNSTRCPFVGNVTCEPTEETRQWFFDQNIYLYTGYSSQIGVLCTAIEVTEDQALLIQLAFDIKADTSELYD
jgi:hypothetical protein